MGVVTLDGGVGWLVEPDVPAAWTSLRHKYAPSSLKYGNNMLAPQVRSFLF
jgi:hypothetical protein